MLYPWPERTDAIRLRTWKSLRILDMLVSSILGRQGDSPSMRSDDKPLDDVPGEIFDSRRLALRATFDLCGFIDDIEHKLLRENWIEADSAEEYLRHLRTWSQELPEELQHYSGPRTGIPHSVDQEICVGATHVACVYHFAIILITRPFLISYLMSQLRQKTNKQPSDSGLDQVQQLQISKLSQICLDSAIYMSNTCHNAMVSGFLLNNMCMIKYVLASFFLNLQVSTDMTQERGYLRRALSLASPSSFKVRARQTRPKLLSMPLAKFSRSSPIEAPKQDITTRFSLHSPRRSPNIRNNSFNKGINSWTPTLVKSILLTLMVVVVNKNNNSSNNNERINLPRVQI